MNEQELLKSAIAASIKVIVEKIIDAMRGTRDLAMTPFVKAKLNEALRELLLAKPNLEKVERALRKAEAYKFDGDELRHVRRYYEPVKPRGRKAKSSGTKARLKRSAKRKRKPGARKARLM